MAFALASSSADPAFASASSTAWLRASGLSASIFIFCTSTFVGVSEFWMSPSDTVVVIMGKSTKDWTKRIRLFFFMVRLSLTMTLSFVEWVILKRYELPAHTELYVRAGANSTNFLGG